MKIFTLFAAALLSCSAAFAGNYTTLIPQPATVEVGQGSLTLPKGFTVAAPEAFTAEAQAFVNAINATTGLQASMAGTGALVTLSVDPSLAAEGYSFEVTANGVDIHAATPAGAFYALQTIKKLLPANVMAGVMAEGTYALPLGKVEDAPRFSYRGFMLDVSRHFFDVNQVKKMLDIMATYKLNRFHWHLTDDQGWRLPVDKWPLLTSDGATNKNILLTDFDAQTQWRAGENVIYGPYAYTKDDIKEVVAYAKARHIEIIPEIDMPGHMVAAIHAYPELSTDPNNERNVHEDMSHEIWNKGGVSRDVLDVSNPRVLEFIHDVVDVLAELFPYEYIHIGGDECPTLAWEKSPACQDFKAQLGLTTDAALQSWFTKQVADYARENHGRKVMGWNEIITSGGADMDMLSQIKPTIFCWIGGEAKSEQYGFDHVYTPFNGGYYINRSYAGIDVVGAVRDGALATTIGVNPPLNSHCIGVQGTFWTEQVDRYTDLEYLALPRLIGIAEQGWSQVLSKDLDEFIERCQADEEYLQLAGYNYGKHQLVVTERQYPEPGKYYYIKSNCTDDRSTRAWEIASNGQLNGATFSEGKEAQMFTFVEDPANPRHYAIVCKARPEGSLGSTPTAESVSGRWNYSAEMHYDFILDKGYYNELANGTFYWAIRPESMSGNFMNFARSGQSYAINVYSNPNDGNGGQMIFVAADSDEDPVTPPVATTEFKPNTYYRLHTRFNGDASQPRYGSVIELLRDAAGKGNNAQEDRLWSNQPANEDDANYDYQWFKFVPDPSDANVFALVCKAKPEGSVNHVPAIANNDRTARFDYDNTSAANYGFYLVEDYQGVDDDGFYSAITTTEAEEGWYMNTAAAGHAYAIHLYGSPTDQNAGLYTFEALPGSDSITEVASCCERSEQLYDLQGRRIINPTHGLYVTHGRKIKL